MPETKQATAEESVLIKDIIEKKDKNQQARNIYERNWLVNIAFLYGKQHFIAENKRIGSGSEERILWELKSEERKNKVKRTANYILPLYRSLLSRLLLMKAHTDVDPATNSEADKSAARVGKEALEDFWQMVNKNNPRLCQKYASMPIILNKSFGYTLATGRSYLKPYFNPKTISKVFMDGEVISGPVGEVECQVLNQFDVFEDPLGQWKIEQKILPVDEIKAQYGVEVKAEDIGLSDIEQQLLTMLEGGAQENVKYDNCARVYEYWQIPNEKYPDGRYVIVTPSKVILDTIIPPEYKLKIPYFSIDYLDIMLSGYPQGMIDQLISLQEDYNFTLTRIYAYKKWFAGKLKVPKDCKLETKYDEEVGQIIYYKQGYGEPHFEAPPNPPQFLYDELTRIRRDMEDIASVHDATKFNQRDIRSGKAIESLNELDNGQLSPVLMNIEKQLSFFAETVLDIIEAKYTEPRVLNITGENEEADVMSFKGGDIQGNRRINVSIGSNMPMNKEARQEFIMLLAEKGYIDRPKALELMEFGDLSSLYNSIDEQAQKMEISEILKAVVIEPNEWDYHQAHIKVLEQYIKSDKFKKLEPMLQQALLKHRSLHQQFLRQEMQTAANMNPARPQAELPPPQQPGE
jgi:hypothetical protein